jgi:OOP family OmpA-OmpF porin
MKNIFIISIISIFLLPLISGAQEEEEAEQYKDTPYFSGMPNYRIIEAADIDFDNYNFYNSKNCTVVEGKKYTRAYTLKEGAKQTSDLQVSRNYANAIKNMGGMVVFEGICEGADCAENCGYQLVIGKITKNNSEMWVEVCPFNSGNDYYLTLVIKEAMRQDVTADGMLESLNRDGFVALYINFDTGKSTIKPESQTIIDQIVEMMKSNPQIILSVEGHTDNVGNPKSNKALSEERAKSVVSALVALNIDIKRLSAIGHGQDKPVADNVTEEGRAKNRRVELVKK